MLACSEFFSGKFLGDVSKQFWKYFSKSSEIGESENHGRVGLVLRMSGF